MIPARLETILAERGPPPRSPIAEGLRLVLLEALKELIECPRGKLQCENAQETVKRIDQ